MSVPRLSRVPDRLPFPDTSGAEPSVAALDALWDDTRSVRVFAGRLGEHGPLESTPVAQISAAELAELRGLLAFDPPPTRFRVPSLGECALELRGRALRVGLVGLERTGVMRVAGWGSDVRLRDAEALFAWIAAHGGPSIELRGDPDGSWAGRPSPPEPAPRTGAEPTADAGSRELVGRGARVLACARHGADLRDLVVVGELVAALDGPLLVRLDGADGPRTLGRLSAVLGHDGRAIVGVRDADLVRVVVDGDGGERVEDGAVDPPMRVLRPWPRRIGATAVVAAGRIVAADVERSGADEPSVRLVRESLETGAVSGASKPRRGVVTGLAAAGGAVLAVVRRSTRPWFGSPRARHELLLWADGGAEPSIVHRVETEAGVAFALAWAPGGGAWLWSPGRATLTSVDVASGATRDVDAAAPVWGLCASARGALAARANEGRIEIVELGPGVAPEILGSFRAEPGRVEVREGAGVVLVAANDRVVELGLRADPRS